MTYVSLFRKYKYGYNSVSLLGIDQKFDVVVIESHLQHIPQVLKPLLLDSVLLTQYLNHWIDF